MWSALPGCELANFLELINTFAGAKEWREVVLEEEVERALKAVQIYSRR